MVLSDTTIKKLVLEQKIITPFCEDQVKEADNVKMVSYGLSSYGYDVRCHDEIYVFEGDTSVVVDPKQFDDNAILTKFSGRSFVMKPYSYLLTRTVEYFNIPRDILAMCVGKSTFARSGILLNTTPLEPEWSGYITLEIANVTPFYVKIYPYEGICQVIFFKGDQPCNTSYKTRKGKYQNQKDVTFPTV